MSKIPINDGGPAFPVSTQGCPGGYGHQDGDRTWQYGGMTLRDYFAAKAMAGILANPYWNANAPFRPVDIAPDAYRYADAMLRAREVQP